MSKKFAQDCLNNIRDERILGEPLGYLLQTLINAMPDEPRTIPLNEFCDIQEDHRKLRIMKAMEDISSANSNVQFFQDGCGIWHQKTAMGNYRINDYYSPKEEPLWEGEIWIHPDRGYGYPGKAIEEDQRKRWEHDGWRAINARQVR